MSHFIWKSVTYPIYLIAKRDFFLKFGGKYVRSSEIHIWRTKWVQPNQITLNQTMQTHTKACITQWFVFCTDILGHPIGPIFKGQVIEKREQSPPEVNWHSLLFWGFVHHLISLRFTMFQKLALLFLEKEAPNLVDTIDWVILNHWALQKQ